MERLKQLVSDLSKEKEESKIVELLQKIEAELLCNYYVKVDDISIYPILIEAYFNSSIFDDKYTHNSPRQRNRFSKVYIHETGRDGIDICLSDNDNFALSFLIKNSLVLLPKQTGNYKAFFSQTQLFDFLYDKDNCGMKEKRDNNGIKYYELLVDEKITNRSLLIGDINSVIYLRRKGLEKQENIDENHYKDANHFDCPLAGFLVENMKEYPLTIEGGKGEAVIEYIRRHNADFESNRDKIDFAIKYANYCPAKIKNGEV